MKAVHIIAISCLVLGMILCVVTLAQGGSDIDIFSTTQFIEDTKTLSSDFSKIRVDTLECDIRFIKTQEDACRIEYRHNAKIDHCFSVENGTLTVNANDQRKWYDHITLFHFRHSEVIVYLPAGHYESVYVSTDTGDVHIPDGFDFDSATICTTTGDITMEGLTVQGKLEAKVSTGKITLTNCTSEMLFAKSTTGDIKVQNATVSGKINLNATTGDIQVFSAGAEAVAAKTTTGGIFLQDVILTGHLALQATTGDIHLTACDAESLDITTSTGDVRGTLRTAKIFQASSSTGRVNVPQTAAGGICKISCSTGDIHISLI